METWSHYRSHNGEQESSERCMLMDARGAGSTVTLIKIR